MNKMMDNFDVVTGAFSYTGKYITRRLLSMGRRVRTVTGHPDRPDPFEGQVDAVPYNFDQPDKLIASLQGASTFYITYWIRFPHGHVTYEQAVRNTEILLKAADDAGVRRVVYVSITNASKTSRFPYFKGKGTIEEMIMGSGLSYAIIRPTVIFGAEDVLINNIAWILRKAPMFAIPGDGNYRLQPIYVEDMAELAVDAGLKEENLAFDAVGPETYTFNDLVHLIAQTVGSHTKITHTSPSMALLMAGMVGRIVNDVILTKDEVNGLMANLLISNDPPTGHTSLSEWLKEHADVVGQHYASELEKHYR